MPGLVEVIDLRHLLPDGRELFKDVSFRVTPGDKVALVGANGAGKTTVLRMIAGMETPRSGAIRTQGRVAFMRQLARDYGSEVTVLEILGRQAPAALVEPARELRAAERLMAQAEPTSEAGMAYAAAVHQWGELGGYDLEVAWNAAALSAVGAPLDDIAHRPVSTLSGGELKRLLLEAIFNADADVLLLDEPDNFLDVRNKEWLEAAIQQDPRAILFVSHDRELLARTTTRVITVEGRGSWTHPASYASYDEARRSRLQNLEEDHRRYREKREALERMIKEFRRRAAMSDEFASRLKASQSRLRQFDEKQTLPERPREQKVTIDLGGGRTGKIALRVTGLSFPGLVKPFDLELLYGDRVGVVGPNGTGKSHFLRTLAGQPIEHTGEVRLGARVAVGYFSQRHDNPDLLSRTPLEVLVRENLERSAAMGKLRRYELDTAADVVFENLSGGQQARLQILLLEVRGSTMLALDEPTDNLDVASADAIEYALWNYEGTVISVSHDRWFLRSFRRFLVFDRDGRVIETESPQWE